MKKLFQLIAAVLIFGWVSLAFGQQAVCPFGSVSVAPLQGFQQNPPFVQQNACVDVVTGILSFPSLGNVLVGGTLGVTGATSLKSLNNTQMCDQFAGTTADVKIAACIAALPSGGGIADARGFGAGNQTIAATVTVGTASKPVTLLADISTVFIPGSINVDMFAQGAGSTISGLHVDATSMAGYTGKAVKYIDGYSDKQVTEFKNSLLVGNGPTTGTAIFMQSTNTNNVVWVRVDHVIVDNWLFGLDAESTGVAGTNFINANVFDFLQVTNAGTCIKLNANPGDVIGNLFPNTQCEKLPSGTMGLQLAGTGTITSNQGFNFNLWDYTAGSTGYSFSAASSRNTFYGSTNAGGGTLTDSGSQNNFFDASVNAFGNDWPINLSGFYLLNVPNNKGLAINTPDTRWNIAAHTNAAGDICFTLAGVAIEICMTNTEIYPNTAGAQNIGKAANPFGNIFLGTAATNNFKIQPAATAGARIITIADPLSPTTVGLPLTIGSGTAAMTTAGILTGACGSTVTVAATGVLTTDTISVSRNAAATIGNGGGLTLNWWPTAGNVNFNYCNSSAGTITPTAMTVNWSVRR